jgi:hypothetical protein
VESAPPLAIRQPYRVRGPGRSPVARKAEEPCELEGGEEKGDGDVCHEAAWLPQLLCILLLPAAHQRAGTTCVRHCDPSAAVRIAEHPCSTPLDHPCSASNSRYSLEIGSALYRTLPCSGAKASGANTRQAIATFNLLQNLIRLSSLHPAAATWARIA